MTLRHSSWFAYVPFPHPLSGPAVLSLHHVYTSITLYACRAMQVPSIAMLQTNTFCIPRLREFCNINQPAAAKGDCLLVRMPCFQLCCYTIESKSALCAMPGRCYALQVVHGPPTSQSVAVHTWCSTVEQLCQKWPEQLESSKQQSWLKFNLHEVRTNLRGGSYCISGPVQWTSRISWCSVK